MTAISSFFSSPAAAGSIDLLFSTPRAQGSSATRSEALSTTAGASSSSGPSASQRALARIVEILTLGAGDDGSVSSATASMSEQLGYITSGRGTAGADSLTATGRAIYDLDSGDGADTLILKSARISGISAGNGDDGVKGAGAFIGTIDGGDGRDDIQLKATLAMDIQGGAGDDSLKVSADTILGLDGGEGNDSLTLEGNRIFATGGAGNDTVSIRTTGANAVVEYGFGRGGGEDTLASNGPLSLDLSGLSAADLTVSVSGNRLTAAINGTDDRISVTLDGSAALSYGFTVKDGRTLLTIR